MVIPLMFAVSRTASRISFAQLALPKQAWYATDTRTSCTSARNASLFLRTLAIAVLRADALMIAMMISRMLST